MARADVAARELLDKEGIVKPPVDPFRIAQELLGVLLVQPEMKDDVSGMLVREPTRTVIGINQGHAATRQRFTVAHEIGHLQLHKGRPLIMDTDVRVNLRDKVSSMATDREEIEANRFAAALLIPDRPGRQPRREPAGTVCQPRCRSGWARRTRTAPVRALNPPAHSAGNFPQS
ncbi:ImmA/IrrE family metallo-endopeptidase [Actinomadura madurae]|uniref:ImmA/IrrE family metallo-endopeptidase n=1 Tax=Actinomadura madurae TaxID=1993 RepID=UPI00399B8BCD